MALAGTSRGLRVGSSRPMPADAPLQRYMAAAVALGDGRVLVTGGYSRPWTKNGAPAPLTSAMIFDPSGGWSYAAPMSIPRARHAAVALSDGRVAVLGGLSLNPTASVEIYDPRTDAWEASSPLSQPRYDHSAASNGEAVFVFGGSSNVMLSSVEIYDPARAELLPGEM